MRAHPVPTVAAALAAAVSLAAGAAAQGHRHGQAGAGQGQHRMGGQPGTDDHQQDMELFHYLGDHGKEITRTVTVLPNGVETVTESDNPEVARKIQAHVSSMAARVKQRRPIHQRDPLFAEVFAHVDRIRVSHDATAKGVKVVETSDDPYVAKLIQAHAEVVSLFIKNGRAEMMKNHDVPAR